tara:strand:+ start:1181 stop:1285 length:105 start_codon:yes stop_codon:yes gene_type:complete
MIYKPKEKNIKKLKVFLKKSKNNKIKKSTNGNII